MPVRSSDKLCPCWAAQGTSNILGKCFVFGQALGLVHSASAEAQTCSFQHCYSEFLWPLSRAKPCSVTSLKTKGWTWRVAALRKQVLAVHFAQNSVPLKRPLLCLWREPISSAPHSGHVQPPWQHIDNLLYLSRLVDIESGWFLPQATTAQNNIPFCDNLGPDWISEPLPVAAQSWTCKSSISTRKTLYCRNDTAAVRQTNAFYEKQLQN